MSYYPDFSAESTGRRLPYVLANKAQRAQALAPLRQRLAAHFPTWQPSAWARALSDLQPDLWLVGPEVVLAEPDLYRLALHLAAFPELHKLDPPLYGVPDLHLVQQRLRTSELTALMLAKVAAALATCSPHLLALRYPLMWLDLLAEQVVPAYQDLTSGPPIPASRPSGGPPPSSYEAAQLLAWLEHSNARFAGMTAGPVRPAAPNGGAAASAAASSAPIAPSAVRKNPAEPRARRSQRDYSLSFKLAVVGEVDRGERSYGQAQQHYGIQGSSTVLTWYRKYVHHFVAAHDASATHPNQLPAVEPTVEQRINQLKQQLSDLEHRAARDLRNTQDLNLLLRTMR